MTTFNEYNMTGDGEPSGEALIENRIWTYLDGMGTAAERQLVRDLIRDEPAWTLKHRELEELHAMLSETEMEEPSMRFTRNVMDEIARLQISPATGRYINKRIIWGIGIFFLTMLACFVIYSIGLIDWGGSNSMPSGRAGEYVKEFNQVDYSRVFNNIPINIFMGINIILGLFLLDRFLANRRKQFSYED